MNYSKKLQTTLSPWPLLLSTGLWNLALSGGASLHHFSKGFLVLVVTIIMIISQYISWNEYFVREATYLKDHAPKVRIGLRGAPMLDRSLLKPFGEMRLYTQLVFRGRVEKTISRGVTNGVKAAEAVIDTAAKQTTKQGVTSTANSMNNRPPTGSVSVHQYNSTSSTIVNFNNTTIRPALYRPDNSLTTSVGERMVANHTFPSRDNKNGLLDIMVYKPEGNYPPQPYKPPYMAARDYHQFTVSKTVDIGVKKKQPISDVFYNGIFGYGNPGDNSALMEAVFSSEAKKHGPKNIQPYFKEEHSVYIPTYMYPRLKTVLNPKDYYRSMEPIAIYKLNNDFIEDQAYLTGEKNFDNKPGYYNNSSNQNPDAVMILTPSVPDSNNNLITEKALDIKMTDSIKFRNRDVIRTPSPEMLGESTKNASRHLNTQLDFVAENSVSKPDWELVKSAKQEIDDNLKNYGITKDAAKFASQHNALHEKYKGLFCRLNIGFNFQVNLSTKDLKTNSEVSEDFRNTYMEITTNPESSLNRYLNSEEFAIAYKTKHISILISEYLGPN